MPASELQELIEMYELEKTSLENSVKEYVAEEEYLMAHYHSRALVKINNTLHTLHNFADTLYEGKRHLIQTKEGFKIMNAEQQSEYLAERIKEIELRLEYLSHHKIREIPDSDELHEAIFDLFEKKEKGFRLILKKAANFWIDFTVSSQTILISLTPVDQITENYFLSPFQIKKIEALGFILNITNGSLEYASNLKDFRNISIIKVLVARIVFDIFNYQEFDRPSFINYHT